MEKENYGGYRSVCLLVSAKLCSAVYCYRSCLFVAVCVCVLGAGCIDMYCNQSCLFVAVCLCARSRLQCDVL